MKQLNLNQYKLQINTKRHYYAVYISNIKNIDILMNVESYVSIVDNKQYNYVTSTYFLMTTPLRLFNMPFQNHFMAKENEAVIKSLYQKLYGL